jgi:hypothetical protein
MSQQPALTLEERRLNNAWEEHIRTEFKAHSADNAIATMVECPRVNQVPVMIGGDGKEELPNSMPNISCPRSRQIRRWSRYRGRLARVGWWKR